MEKSEPSLVPEWLRSTGGGTGGGSSSHHFASLQADGPVLALPKRNRSSKSIGNPDASHSSLLEQTSSSNFRRSSSSNGSVKHEKNSYSRPYSSFTRSQRDRDKERLTIADNWDLEYSDPLRSMITGRTEDTLRRSQSMISRRQGEVLQKRSSTDLRNGSFSNHDNGNGSHTPGSSVGGLQKVSFEKDFPLLGSDERPKTPKTPDIIRVSSPGLSRGVQSLPIGNSQLVGGEPWTSALAEVPTGAGSNDIGSCPASQAPSAGSGANLTSVIGSTSSGLNMAEALVQAPAKTHNIPQPSVQAQRDELAIAQSKKLIPMTPVLPKTLALNSSDKLKPKIAVRSGDTVVTPKNGAHQLSPLQLGGPSARGTSARVDSPKSPSSGKLLVLKSGRENGAPLLAKDIQSQTPNMNNRVANGQSPGAPSVASVPLKSPSNSKLSSVERMTSTSGFNPGPVVDKRPSLSQAQSRHDFFNLMRIKSMNTRPGTADSGRAAASDTVDKSDKVLKELPNDQMTPDGTGNEVKCEGETFAAAESLSYSRKNGNAAIYPVEEEEAFLRSLGWEDNAGDDEGLTEEEINAFYQEVMRLRATSKLCRGLWLKILSHCEIHAACSGAASTEPTASASQTEA